MCYQKLLKIFDDPFSLGELKDPFPNSPWSDQKLCM